MKFDNLYIPDPFTHNILKPENCYIEFPYWPNELYRRPRNDDFYIPYVPPYQPYNADETHQKTWQEALKKLRNEPEYFTISGRSLKFRLELAGYAKENISVTVDKTGTLKVKSINHDIPYDKSWAIPEYQKYDLESPEASMVNGLLEIFFTLKKEEKAATIKIL